MALTSLIISGLQIYLLQWKSGWFVRDQSTKAVRVRDSTCIKKTNNFRNYGHYEKFLKT